MRSMSLKERLLYKREFRLSSIDHVAMSCDIDVFQPVDPQSLFNTGAAAIEVISRGVLLEVDEQE